MPFFSHFFAHIQQLLTRCGSHGRFDWGNLEGGVWTLFPPGGFVVGLLLTSGGGKNLIFFPTDGSWNNYLHFQIFIKNFQKAFQNAYIDKKKVSNTKNVLR